MTKRRGELGGAYLRARGAVIRKQQRERSLEEKLNAQIGANYRIVRVVLFRV